MNCIAEMEELKSKSNITEDEFRRIMLSITIRKLELDFTGLIGRGYFGDTIGVKLPTMVKDVAVKVVSKENVGVNETRWAALHHRNIMPLLESQYFPGLEVQLFITPIEPFNLRQMLRDEVFFRDAEAISKVVNWVKEILLGVNYLHGKNLAHFNIQASNVLISANFTARLFDFHFLNDADSLTRSYNLTYMYRPPEAFGKKDGNAPVAGKPFDIWSLGILAVNIFTQEYLDRKTPNPIPSWSERIYPEIYKVLQEGNFVSHYKSAFPGGHVRKEDFKYARNFAAACLFFDPNQRFSAEKLLRHALLEEGGFLVKKDRIWVNKEKVKTLDKRILEICTVMPEESINSSAEAPCPVGNVKSVDGLLASKASLDKTSFNVQQKLSGDSSAEGLKGLASTPEAETPCLTSKPVSEDEHFEQTKNFLLKPGN